MRFVVAIAVLVLALFAARPAAADGAPPAATFALIIGSNQSVDRDVPPLRYADDDAARYLDLFRLLGARTYLLSRLDENTRRLHPQSVAEAMEPRKAAYEEALRQLASDVTQAAGRGVETVVYFVYAGHGNVDNGIGYITLEDTRLTGADLASALAKVPAKTIHVIVDACSSYFFAYGRGPGGERRPIGSFGLVPALGADPRIGLLLSTSSARESHEWDAFQSGVFSHEVRSGLYGAADADGDGFVSYREVAAFVATANATVPNERYRPDVHARAPRGDGTLLDVRRARGRRLEIDGRHAGHYYLEDWRGVRVADVHNADGQDLSLIRPAPGGRVYLRRVDDDKEFVVPAGSSPTDVITLADLSPERPRVASRGAAHESFSALFSLPFDANVVDDYQEPPEPQAPAPDRPTGHARSLRRPIALGSIVLGGLAIGAGAALSISAAALRADGGSVSQVDAVVINDKIRTRTTAAAICYVGGGIAAAAGIALFLWPSGDGVRASVSSSGGTIGYSGVF
jgi:hypothetical protein